ncbi:MAG: DUF1080 domain-containing protein, partial [Draconibacterium sp.]|nr:DUF1080 domain-containing protein [Draconibacterium sp.]
MKKLSITIIVVFFTLCVSAQEQLFSFGKEVQFQSVTHGDKAYGKPISWIQVNTEADTWNKNGEELVCSGHPIGVIRSEKKYRNFIMHIEWKHMEAGGNSGTFVWSDAEPGDNRLPNGVEVQMLELEWVKLNTRDGKEPPIAYVHGELFGVGGTETVPDNPRGRRSKSIENRCKGKGQWNTYEVVCVDGTIKLSVNGKFVNGISKSTKKEG